MLIHQYDALTGQYTSSRLADADPRNPGRWLVPAFSTDAELPARTALTWPFFLDAQWTLLPDYRGRVLYRTDSGEPAEILIAGTTPDEHGLTETPRPSDEYTWRDGAWVVDQAIVAQRVRAQAMAEFDTRMAKARAINNGKSDAYTAGLLSEEDTYNFRAWSSYQLALVSAIQREGFPDSVVWPTEPDPFEQGRAKTMAEFDRRMAIATAKTDGQADAYARGVLSVGDANEFLMWSTYIDRLKEAVAHDMFIDAVIWPNEPVTYAAAPFPEPQPESGDTNSEPQAPTEPA